MPFVDKLFELFRIGPKVTTLREPLPTLNPSKALLKADLPVHALEFQVLFPFMVMTYPGFVDVPQPMQRYPIFVYGLDWRVYEGYASLVYPAYQVGDPELKVEVGGVWIDLKEADGWLPKGKPETDLLFNKLQGIRLAPETPWVR